MSWFIRRQLKSKSARVRRQALLQLRGQADDVIVPLIEAVLAVEEQRSVQVAALEVLGSCRGLAARRVVFSRLGTPDPAVQLAIVEAVNRLALQQFNPQWETAPEAQSPVERLRAAACSHDFGVRHAAEEALRLLGATPQAGPSSRKVKPGDALVGLLAEFAGDSDASVAMAVSGAISQRQLPGRAEGV
jgi:HEAT repeat protein